MNPLRRIACSRRLSSHKRTEKAVGLRKAYKSDSVEVLYTNKEQLAYAQRRRGKSRGGLQQFFTSHTLQHALPEKKKKKQGVGLGRQKMRSKHWRTRKTTLVSIQHHSFCSLFFRVALGTSNHTVFTLGANLHLSVCVRAPPGLGDTQGRPIQHRIVFFLLWFKKKRDSSFMKELIRHQTATSYCTCPHQPPLRCCLFITPMVRFSIAYPERGGRFFR